MATDQIDYEGLREQVKAGDGPAYWRSLEELAHSPEFQQKMAKEFPSQQAQWMDPASRRGFLKVMGASLALSGLTACNFSKPREKILPYIKQPEHMVIGKPQYYATAMPYRGYGYPLLVESHAGRPTKVEGNPDHPMSLGAATICAQASVLNLYDPDRSQVVQYLGELRNWEAVLQDIASEMGSQSGKQGAGLRILTETVTSPTMASLMDKVAERFPQSKWIQYDPCGRSNMYEGMLLATGAYGEALYDFSKATVVLSLDADFTVEGPGALRNAKQFSAGRKLRSSADSMSRFYAVESSVTCTGTLADHRLTLKPSLLDAFARAVAAGIGVANAGERAPALTAHAKFLDTVIADLKAAGAQALVIAGEDQPAAIHALAHQINSALGAVGSTVSISPAVIAKPSNQLADLKALAADMNAGTVDALFIFGGNPVYESPADIDFGTALKNVRFTVRHGEYVDETSEWCRYHLPAPHYLETWGDVRCGDGTASIIQPLIAPLFNSRTDYELVHALTGGSGKSSFDLVQEFWKTQKGEANFEKFWRKSVHDGFIADSLPTVAATSAAAGAIPPAATGGKFEVVFRPDPSLGEGRHANNAWLQELPRPFTKVTWDNVIQMSMATATELGFKTQNVAKLTVGGRSITGPVFVTMGQPADTVTVHMGYGRTRSGRVGMEDDSYGARGAKIPAMITKAGDKARGYNAFKLWESGTPMSGAAVQIEKVGDEIYELACTQLHFAIEDNDVNPERDIPVIGAIFKDIPKAESVQLGKRGLVRRASLDAFKKFEEEHKVEVEAHTAEITTTKTVDGHHDDGHGDAHGHGAHGGHHTFATSLGGPHVPSADLDLYQGSWEYKNYAWGMAIDTGSCTGCNACVIACQAENNIPVVGKEEVMRQHEMHWIRIDQYYTGDLDTPRITNQPLPCMHCENAPCEVVCPVLATVHSEEGLNDMVYNRCVGTRFCSNNCPYKVRRFNWFYYTEQAFKSSKDSPLANMVHNPDVTVRTRGVMEKCTYCTQRIASARIEANNEGRRIRDGDIVTACEATCPTDAIVFGDINDPNSRVSRMKASTLNYGLLVDLNNKPRTSYLAAINNINPEIGEA